MVKHTQTIRRLLPMNCLSVFDHFANLALKGLMVVTFVLVSNMYLRIQLVKFVEDSL